MNTPATATAKACLSCGTLGGYLRVGHRVTPDRTRGLCNSCKQRERKSGAYWDRPLSGWHGSPAIITSPTGIITPAMLGITADQPPTDPALTPAIVWAIAHRNAARATHWLVNTGRMTPDEAAALAYLSYEPQPEDAARRAA